MRSGTRCVSRVALALAPLALLACVEGVTPNCSDPATPCGPSVDAASEGSTPDAAPDARDASVPDTSSADADADAPLDAPDGG